MDLTQLRGIDYQKTAIKKIILGLNDPEKYEAVRNWRDRLYSEPLDYELKLRAIDSIMDAHGVEVLIADETGKAIASYVNTGDTYSATVLYDLENEEFLVTSWGDFYEEWKTKNVIEIDCKALAGCIHGLSHSPLIPWEEWVEDDREEYDSDEDFLDDAYIDIRLQVMDDHQWYFHSGDSSYDTDHRGAWGSSSVGKCVSMDEAMEIARDLIEQAAESADCCLTKQVRIYNDGN